MSPRQDKMPDAQAREGACQAYARAVKADILLDKEGIIIKETAIVDGEVVVLKMKKHPAVEISNRAWMAVKSFCCEFGFTPVSRVRLTLDKRSSSDGEDDLLKVLTAPREKPTVESDGSGLIQ